jgi:hypothetical protein
MAIGSKAANAPTRKKPRVTGAKTVQRSEKDEAISTELAPAVAIALLGEATHVKGEISAALEPMAAGTVTSKEDGKVRVQLLFENGAVLPVEMTGDAAAALGKGIARELRKT